jgi:histidine ammonia-lyase
MSAWPPSRRAVSTRWRTIPLRSSQTLESVHAQLREQVAPYDADRFFAPDIEAARTMVWQGALSASCKTLFSALHP